MEQGNNIHLQPYSRELYCDHYGTMRIEGNHEYSCKLKFKEQSIIDRNPHQASGGGNEDNACLG
ncbi:hypothetical protein JRO89_XS08G0091900 [Xanthoceras sorbifolium]|uniref:Uncharacterized protein n=1 Tax=Xanthoceras sorbifolium TaxID=99658 RepID=A0ABQ8HP49_9ROSI|nr:hypothetical protein JRO89_XS08G0091900 [Xanthoceras sorbifolium]